MWGTSLKELNVTTINSTTVGDPACFRSLAELERMLKTIRSGEDEGRVTLVMRRAEGGRRERLESVVLTPDQGVPGDAWARKPERSLDMQIAVMEKDVAEMIANGQPLTLFGDCLILDLDLSTANLPTGSRLQIGQAVLQVTPYPHTGCRKFLARFGEEALRFVSTPALRHRHLRGIYLRVVEAGEVKPQDPVKVLSRPQLEARQA
jgi:MOSC domain-containing protein YiiM